MYNLSQEQIFIIFFIIGLSIGIIFDIFRAIRKIFKMSDFITVLQDISFMAISGIIIVNSLIIINNGQIRFYILIAILVGIFFYLLTISRFSIIIFQKVLIFFKKILSLPSYFKKVYHKKKDF